jgi:hypothetical protein
MYWPNQARRQTRRAHYGPDAGRTLLRAERRGNVESVKLLLEAGADARAKDENGRTAPYSSNAEMMKLLDAATKARKMTGMAAK